MLRTNRLHKFILILFLLALALNPLTPAFAQTADNTPTLAETSVITSAASNDTTVGAEKGEFTPGESSSIDMGKSRIFLPMITGGNSGQVDAAATNFAWQTVFSDEFCTFPNSWLRVDANGTGQLWTQQTVGGFCTAKPSGYTHKMNTYMQRTFSLAGAVDARLIFSFKMNTEANFDFLRYEFSCNGGKNWQSRAVTAESGAVSTWTTRTASLVGCLGVNSVIVRFTFQTDSTVTSTEAPTIDFVRVEKLS